MGLGPDQQRQQKLRVIREATYRQIYAIATRPEMYASCKESYVAQLAQLLEVSDVRGGPLWDMFPRDGAAYVGLTDKLDDEWANRIGMRAKELIKRALEEVGG